jgi:flavin reductase (DIM6/NTAB) family NADH-FMN oxidoreductase RutF
VTARSSAEGEDRFQVSGSHRSRSTRSYLECRTTQRVPAGDHEIVVARPVAGEILLPDAIPLTYADTGDLDGSRDLYPPSL